MPPKPQSPLLCSEDLATPAFHWLGLRKILWIDLTGEEREWEAAYRKTRKGNLDGVTVICRIVHDQPDLDEVVLVSQFRPALGVLVMKAPAGLMDDNESAQEAASLRGNWNSS
ncbi:unnamed protein product [Ectocarpus sp. 12 AP-2014]